MAEEQPRGPSAEELIAKWRAMAVKAPTWGTIGGYHDALRKCADLAERLLRERDGYKETLMREQVLREMLEAKLAEVTREREAWKAKATAIDSEAEGLALERDAIRSHVEQIGDRLATAREERDKAIRQRDRIQDERDEWYRGCREAEAKLEVAVKALKRIAPADNEVARWARRALEELQKSEGPR